MATITRDLGPVTAYKYAVSKGFTGTEEEFAQLMADLANMSSRIIAVEDDVEQVEGKVNSFDDELAVVETTVTSQGTRISTVENNITTLRSNKLAKSGDQVLELSGTVPRVSVVATNIAGRFVASDTSNRLGIWDETRNEWVIYRDTNGNTHIPNRWTRTLTHSSGGHFQEVWRNLDAGLMIINIRYTVNVAITSASGNIYYGTATLPDFDVAFAEKPTVTYTTESGGSGLGNAWVWGRTAPSATSPGGVYLGRGNSTAAINLIINVQAIGCVAS